MKRSAVFNLAILFLTGSVFGQLDLSRIYSLSMNSGYTMPTVIDSLQLDTKANNGIAQTRLGLVLVPGTSRNYVSEKDSLEISVAFSLPTDFAIDSMWLWVDGEPVNADLQDRALAAGQYQQITKIRRDPALLEFSGNGQYSLRIFPAFTGKPRKIEIQFQHTFDDDSADVITASIPVTYDSSRVYNYYDSSSIRSIRNIQASFKALDSKSYFVDIPGLGTGTFNGTTSIVLKASNVSKLVSGTISSKDLSGSNDFLWIGHDAVRQKYSAGITTELTEASLSFEPEPDTRVIAIDIKDQFWDWDDFYNKQAKYTGYNYTYNSYQKSDILARAQKYAILCLEHYIGDKQKFNIVFGGSVTSTLFPEPVPAHPEYIKKAVEAILKYTPSGSSSSLNIMNKAIEQASSGVVIWISDLFQPYNYYDSTVYPTKYLMSASGEHYNSVLDSVQKMTQRSDITLFTIDDNSRISQISYESGGYRLGNLLNAYRLEYKYEIVDSRKITIPILPPLFGSRNSSGFRNIKISSEELGDVVYTTDGYNYNWWNVGLTDMRVIGLNKLTLPTYNRENTVLRIAGQSNTPVNNLVTFTVKGKTGGLRFYKNITAQGSSVSIPSQVQKDFQWAFRNSEALAGGVYADKALAIKAVGKIYHVVTRQTSLLALEPGMKLWEDTLWASQNVDLKVASSALRVSADMADVTWSSVNGAPNSSLGTGSDLDGFTLEGIASMEGVVVGVKPVLHNKKEFSVHNIAGGIRLALPEISGNLHLQLFDLKGRLVAQKMISVRELRDFSCTWNFKESNKISNGSYLLHVLTGTQKKVLKLSLLGR